ncbi:MAG: IPTL-CTERM sorting domain-containing protein [Xanthomonadales bacterium]|nr:IPTL-CTERM sorting domain-containing protein [Xanthomonadales bacterium]
MYKSIRFLSLLAGVLLTGGVYAQTITVGTASGAPGDTVTVPLNWDNGGTDYRTLQFDVDFPLANLPSVDTTDCPLPPFDSGDYIQKSCDQRAAPNEDQVRLGLLRLAGGIPSGKLGDLSFTIANDATPGNLTLSVTGVVIEGDPTPIIVNGSITVTAAPAAAYTSNPAPGLLDLGSVIQNAGSISSDLSITNSGATGTTLTGTCSETADPGNVFSISNGAFSVLQGAAADTVTVSCDSAGAITTHTGTMECTHNGDDAGEASPAVYNLSCTITAGPQPAYGSTPAPGATISMSAANEGDAIANETVVIDNIGDDGTTLSGTCSVSGDTEITLAGGAFSVVQGGATSTQTLSCDSSAEGEFSATLSCSHNGSNIASPAGYTVNCSVGPLRPAVFASNPPDGTSVDISGGTGVVVGDAAPEVTAQISNDAVAPAQDLDISCSVTGDAAISVAPDLSGGALIPAGSSASATFSCATDTAGTFTATFSCEYVTDTSGEVPVGGTATWPLSCEVRDPKSEVTPDPAGGTTLTERADPGGTAQFSVMFDEIADEGVDGSVDCSLDDGTNFSIDTSLPAAVPAGGSLTVTVTGTDPADGSTSVTDTLDCTYTDTDNAEPGVQVSYPLVLEIGGDASFLVTKTFSDGTIRDVQVAISCNDGFVNADTATISSDGQDSFRFIVSDFIAGAMDCEITEEATPGYASDSCTFTDVSPGQYECALGNDANDATFTVNKVWDLTGAVGAEVDQRATITISCNNVITSVTGGTIPDYVQPRAVVVPAPNFAVRQLDGDGDIVVTVDTTDQSAVCSATETIMASGVEPMDDCDARTIAAGESSECTFTNTVFFEGIPTLSQYGLALMALLMLGIGMVGFRRFA